MSEITIFASPYLEALRSMEESGQVPPGTAKKVFDLGKVIRQQKRMDPIEVIKKAKKGAKAKRALSQKEIDAIFSVTRNHFVRTGRYRPLLFFAIGLYTGLRVSDILSVTWENLLDGYSTLPTYHQKEDFFLIKEKKTQRFGVERKIYINTELRMVINYIFRCRGNRRKRTGFVFRSPSRGGPVKPESARKKFYQFLDEVGLDHIKDRIGSHSLRKTFALNLFRALGSNENAKEHVRQVIGHKSTTTTEVYLGLDNESLRDAYHALSYRPQSLYGIEDEVKPTRTWNKQKQSEG